MISFVILVFLLIFFNSNVNCLELHEIATIGSHNSFHSQPLHPYPSIAYSHPSLVTQLSQGLRQLEIDIQEFQNPVEGFSVYHIPIYDVNSTCTTTTECFSQICQWSQNTTHQTPIFILLDFAFELTPLEEVALLDSIYGSCEETQVLTPAQVALILDMSPDAPTSEILDEIKSVGWGDIGHYENKVVFFGRVGLAQTLLDTVWGYISIEEALEDTALSNHSIFLSSTGRNSYADNVMYDSSEWMSLIESHWLFRARTDAPEYLHYQLTSLTQREINDGYFNAIALGRLQMCLEDAVQFILATESPVSEVELTFAFNQCGFLNESCVLLVDTEAVDCVFAALQLAGAGFPEPVEQYLTLQEATVFAEHVRVNYCAHFFATDHFQTDSDFVVQIQNSQCEVECNACFPDCDLSELDGCVEIDPPTPQLPTESFVAITEFMPFPRISAGFEWIEIFNFGADDVDLNGWTIEADNIEERTLADEEWILASGEYALIAMCKACLLNQSGWEGFEEFQLVPNQFGDDPECSPELTQVGGIELGNSGDTLRLRDADGVTKWSVSYDEDTRIGVSVMFVEENVQDFNSLCFGVDLFGVDDCDDEFELGYQTTQGEYPFYQKWRYDPDGFNRFFEGSPGLGHYD